MKLGEYIKDKRLKANMGQLELSETLGYQSVQFVSLFERGLSKVPMNVLGKCFVIFDVPQKERKNVFKKHAEKIVLELLAEVNEGENAIKP